MRNDGNMCIRKVDLQMLNKISNPLFDIFIAFTVWKSIRDAPIGIGIEFAFMMLVEFTIIGFS